MTPFIEFGKRPHCEHQPFGQSIKDRADVPGVAEDPYKALCPNG